ncbi:MAG: hypothetical protein CM15mV58_630 [uncultured marine virus]|nr:MAG: hypothetical protein CM15mV58_630 [uncultured marine virus]
MGYCFYGQFQQGELSDVVKPYIDATGSETVGSGESALLHFFLFGSVGLDDADSSSFTAFGSITKDNAVAWGKAKLGTDEVTSKASLESQITEQKKSKY